MERQLSHSQNFLKSPERVFQLLDRTSIKAGDLVYDIGAGTGTITEAFDSFITHRSDRAVSFFEFSLNRRQWDRHWLSLDQKWWDEILVVRRCS